MSSGGTLMSWASSRKTCCGSGGVHGCRLAGQAFHVEQRCGGVCLGDRGALALEVHIHVSKATKLASSFLQCWFSWDCWSRLLHSMASMHALGWPRWNSTVPTPTGDASVRTAMCSSGRGEAMENNFLSSALVPVGTLSLSAPNYRSNSGL